MFPVIESLGPRVMLSASGFDISLKGGVLSVTGTAKADGIYVDQDSRYLSIKVPKKGGHFRTLFSAPTKKVKQVRVFSGGGDDYVDCHGVGARRCIVHGGKGDDFILGSHEDDELHGDAGNDQIHAGDGADDLFGESGNDVLLGGAGNDSIIGGSGTDALYGGLGDDDLDSKDGILRDTISGGPGNDYAEADLDQSDPTDDLWEGRSDLSVLDIEHLH